MHAKNLINIAVAYGRAASCFLLLALAAGPAGASGGPIAGSMRVTGEFADGDDKPLGNVPLNQAVLLNAFDLQCLSTGDYSAVPPGEVGGLNFYVDAATGAFSCTGSDTIRLENYVPAGKEPTEYIFTMDPTTFSVAETATTLSITGSGISEIMDADGSSLGYDPTVATVSIQASLGQSGGHEADYGHISAMFTATGVVDPPRAADPPGVPEGGNTALLMLVAGGGLLLGGWRRTRRVKAATIAAF